MCVLCRVKGQTAIFEEMIEDEDGLVDDRLPTTSRGLWAASEMERALKAILSFAKIRRMESGLTEEGNAFMELFESWKKEYKVCYLLSMYEQISFVKDHNEQNVVLCSFSCCTSTGCLCEITCRL